MGQNTKIDRVIGGAEVGPLALQALIVWTLEADSSGIWLRSSTLPKYLVVEAAGVKECSLAFDKEMNHYIAYSTDSNGQFYLFDGTDTVQFDGSNPKLILDEIRPEYLQESQVLLTYVKDETLMQRSSLDGFTVEKYIEPRNEEGLRVKILELKKVTLGSNNRIHMECRIGDLLPVEDSFVATLTSLPYELIFKDEMTTSAGMEDSKVRNVISTTSLEDEYLTTSAGISGGLIRLGKISTELDTEELLTSAAIIGGSLKYSIQETTYPAEEFGSISAAIIGGQVNKVVTNTTMESEELGGVSAAILGGSLQRI